MPETHQALLCGAIFLVAALYSSVGQAGASGFIAVMALFGVVPETLKPTALALNILVSIIVSIRFYREGYFSWQLFWPFAILAVPFAALGGYLDLPPVVFNRLLGVILVVASVPVLGVVQSAAGAVTRPRFGISLVTGAGIGFLSGLTAVGGGILLAPLLLLFRWAETKEAAAVSAVFILVNSIAAIAAHFRTMTDVPTGIPMLALAAGTGGFLGSHLGSVHLPAHAVRKLLGCVLMFAGAKLLLA